MVITNVTLNGKFTCELDLYFLARSLWNVEYNPKKFNALVLRIRKPRATACIFQNGSINVMGCCSVKDAEIAAKKFRSLISKRGFNVRLQNVRITNYVGKYFLGCKINLHDLSKVNGVEWTPELFHGAKFSIENCTLVIFSSGTIIACGRSIEMHHKAITMLKELLRNM